MTPTEAETLALQALAFLAQSPDEIDRFLVASGISPPDLRERAGDPEILAAIMDFVLADDTRITDLCDALATDPRVLHAVRRALPGG